MAAKCTVEVHAYHRRNVDIEITFEHDWLG